MFKKSSANALQCFASCRDDREICFCCSIRYQVVSKDIRITQKYPNENTVGFTIEEEGYNERFDIYVQFSNPSYGDFIVQSQSVYNPILDEYITYSGTGTLTKNGSSCYYTITLDLNYSYNGINFNYNCIGSDDISLY